MKNILTAIFMLVVCVAGTVIAAAIYFTVAYGALSALMGGGSATRLGEAVGSAAGALGFPLGAAVFGMTFWDRLVRHDGSPDRLARVLAVILALPLALIPFFALILTALGGAAQFSVLGFFALAGFLGIAGWVEQKTRSTR